RMRSALAGLDEGEFTEGHELDRKWKVEKEMIGRRLSERLKHRTTPTADREVICLARARPPAKLCPNSVSTFLRSSSALQNLSHPFPSFDSSAGVFIPSFGKYMSSTKRSTCLLPCLLRSSLATARVVPVPTTYRCSTARLNLDSSLGSSSIKHRVRFLLI